MKTQDSSSQRIQKIGEELKKGVIEPAKQEAERLLNEARLEALAIHEAARREALNLLDDAKRKMERGWEEFQASLSQAAKQVIATLKLEIESKVFSENLHALISQHAEQPEIIAKLIETVLNTLEREGLSTNLTALIPKQIAPHEINALLGKELLNKLREKSVILGGHFSGAQIRMNDKNITLDISDKALMEMMANYRKDFRKAFFGP